MHKITLAALTALTLSAPAMDINRDRRTTVDSLQSLLFKFNYRSLFTIFNSILSNF
jgi:hypothetical protein